MKAKHLLFIAATFFSISIFAQTTSLVWAYDIKNTKAYQGNYAYDMVIDNSGNFYVAGSFQYSVDIDPSAATTTIAEVSNGVNDIYLAKYNPSGALIWVKTIGSTGDEAAMDLFLNNNTIYMCGYFTSPSLDFDPGPGTYTLASGGTTAFASTYDMNGNFLSAFKVNTSYAHGISADNSGNIYLAGEFYGTNVDFDPGAAVVPLTSTMNGTYSTWDMFYAKYTPTASCVWAKTIGSSAGSTCCGPGTYNDYASCIAVNNINGDVAIGGQVGSSGQGRLILTNSAGTTLRNMTFANEGTGTGVAFDNAGNLYFSGDYGWNSATEDFDWNATTFNLTSTSTYGHAFVVKYDASYNLAWATKITSIVQYFRNLEVELDNNQDPLIVGSEASSSSTSNIEFGKLDKNSGAVIWKDVLSGGCSNGLNNTWGYGIGYSPTDGNVVVVGAFGGSSINTTPCSLDADPGAGVYNLNGAVAGIGQTEIFLGKYGSCAGAPSGPGSISGLNTICIGASASVYSIVAVSGAASYTWSLPGGWSGTSSTNTISAASGTSSGNISVSALNSCGSSSASVLSVTVNPSPTITVSSGTICSGQNFIILPGGANTYTFQGGSATVSPTTTTSYTVSGTNLAGCVSASPATSNVTVNPLPTIAVNSGAICNGQNFTMIPNGASTYTFQGGSAVVSPTTTNSYTVMGTDALGCVSALPATSNVTVNPLPAISANTSNTLLCTGQTATLTGSGASTYTWNPGGVGTSISVSPTVTSTYSISGTDANGCMNSASFTQNVSGCVGITQLEAERSEFGVWPNPTNGLLIVKGKIGSEIQIYNLLGSMLYKTKIESEKTEIDLSNQTNGVYFIKVGSVTKKIIKE